MRARDMRSTAISTRTLQNVYPIHRIALENRKIYTPVRYNALIFALLNHPCRLRQRAIV